MTHAETILDFKQYGIPYTQYDLSSSISHFGEQVFKKFQLDCKKLKCIKLLRQLNLHQHIKKDIVLAIRNQHDCDKLLKKLRLVKKYLALIGKINKKKGKFLKCPPNQQLATMHITAIEAEMKSLEKMLKRPRKAKALERAKQVQANKKKSTSGKSQSSGKRRWRPPYFRLIYTPMRG